MKPIGIFVLIVMLTMMNFYSARAQEAEVVNIPSVSGSTRSPITPETILSVDPVSLFNKRLKFTFERQIKEDKDRYFLLTLGAYYFPEEKDYVWESIVSGYDNFKKMNGYSIGGAYKQFFRNSRFYWQTGLECNHYRVKYLSYDYYSFTENGLQFFEYRGKDVKKNFLKLSPNLNVGIQIPAFKVIVLDLYLGVAYNHSFYSGQKAFTNYGGFGQRGISATGGVNLGIAIGK